MTTDTDLTKRIDAEFSAAEERWDQLRAVQLEAYRTRSERLERFEQTVDALRELWEPRLQALAKRFGKNMDAHLTEELGRRSASLEFGSNVAHIILRFAVSPDADVTNLVVTYDVEILPVLMKFDSHKELALPLDAIDNTQLANWIDDRIVKLCTHLPGSTRERVLSEGADGRRSDCQGTIPEVCRSCTAGRERQDVLLHRRIDASRV